MEQLVDLSSKWDVPELYAFGQSSPCCQIKDNENNLFVPLFSSFLG
jgi:hypothetical protein